jgi:hypothetical protein
MATRSKSAVEKLERVAVMTIGARVYLWGSDILGRGRAEPQSLSALTQTRLEQVVLGRRWFYVDGASVNTRTAGFHTLAPEINAVLTDLIQGALRVLDAAAGGPRSVGTLAVPTQVDDIRGILRWVLEIQCLLASEQEQARIMVDTALEISRRARLLAAQKASHRRTTDEEVIERELTKSRYKLSRLRTRVTPAALDVLVMVEESLDQGQALQEWPWLTTLHAPLDQVLTKNLSEDLLDTANLLEDISDLGYFKEPSGVWHLDDQARLRMRDVSDALRLVKYWIDSTQPKPAVKRCAVCFRHRTTRKYCAVHKSVGRHPDHVRQAERLYSAYEEVREKFVASVATDPVWLDPDTVLKWPGQRKWSPKSDDEEEVWVHGLYRLLRAQVNALRSVMGNVLFKRLSTLAEYFYASALFQLSSERRVDRPTMDALRFAGLMTAWFQGIPMPPSQLSWAGEGADPNHPLVQDCNLDSSLIVEDLLMHCAWLEVESKYKRATRIDRTAAKALFKKGLSYRAIARELGVSHQGIINALAARRKR